MKRHFKRFPNKPITAEYDIRNDLAKTAESDSANDRLYVAQFPYTPKNILEKLVSDPVKKVADAAKKMLDKQSKRNRTATFLGDPITCEEDTTMRKINASRWNYTLKCGKALRQAIDDENPAEILTILQQAWTEIHQNFPDEYDENDLESDLDDIENELDNVENYEDYDMTYEDVEDNIDYMLNNLYDFCDSFSIWVDM